MDEHMLHTDQPPTLNSVHFSGELRTSTAELNKKRKLQYEVDNLGLPWPKQKFRDRSSRSKNERNPLEELKKESDNDSSSSIGVDDNIVMLDVQGNTEESFLQTFPKEQPSTSSNSSNYNVLKNSYSWDSASIKNANKEGPADLEDTLQSEPRGGDYIDPETAEYGMDFAEAEMNDAMLYSNDVAPNAFLLSSGRWSLGPDARFGSRKPTIDQEFEQYFSMLML